MDTKKSKDTPWLIILAGLPGTGKTTIARLLAKEFSLLYLRADSVEAPFRNYDPTAGSHGEGYQALINLALENLMLGQGVIIDTVNPLHLSRAMFLHLADQTRAHLLQFELKTRSTALHKGRVEERRSDLPGFSVPSWQDVLDREYEEWDPLRDGPATVIWTDDFDEAVRSCLEAVSMSNIRAVEAEQIP